MQSHGAGLQAGVTWEEGMWTCLWGISLTDDQCGRVQLNVGSAIRRHLDLGSVGKQAEQASKQYSPMVSFSSCLGVSRWQTIARKPSKPFPPPRCFGQYFTIVTESQVERVTKSHAYQDCVISTKQDGSCQQKWTISFFLFNEK